MSLYIIKNDAEGAIKRADKNGQKKTGRQLEERVTPCITPKNQMKTIYI